MACGVPVVATKIAGTPEAVKDGTTGFLVLPRKPQLIAKKTTIILKNQNLREKMGKNARKKIEEEFSWERVIPQLVNILKETAFTKRSRKHP
jgi:spore coat protein SA